MKFGASTPILRMFNEAKAREFYINWLGFKIDFEHRFETDVPLYMGISRGACKLHLSEHHGDSAPGAAVRIQVDGLDEYHRALSEAVYKFYRPVIQAMEWGTREMAVQDGFGNKLIFFDEPGR